MSEKEWRPWRAIFSPGFSNTYLTGLIPHMVEETMIYNIILREHAQRREIFELDTVTLWFTMNLIGRVAL